MSGEFVAPCKGCGNPKPKTHYEDCPFYAKEHDYHVKAGWIIFEKREQTK